jgi:hypothetical protein
VISPSKRGQAAKLLSIAIESLRSKASSSAVRRVGPHGESRACHATGAAVLIRDLEPFQQARSAWDRPARWRATIRLSEGVTFLEAKSMAARATRRSPAAIESQGQLLGLMGPPA